ncbi:MAG: HEAT repeat domain-containing protein [Thiotrichales bacterium]
MKLKILLLISSSCPHCATVLQSLSEMIKAGEFARLEIINLEVDPKAGEKLGVRSVPWIQIGDFELAGLHSKAELAHWISLSRDARGMVVYLGDLLETGQIGSVTNFIERHPAHFESLLNLLADPDATMNQRIGVSAVVESLEGSDLLAARTPELIKYSTHESPAVRADACHFLSLTHSSLAIPVLEARLQDEDAAVREIAQESLTTLQDHK